MVFCFSLFGVFFSSLVVMFALVVTLPVLVNRPHGSVGNINSGVLRAAGRREDPLHRVGPLRVLIRLVGRAADPVGASELRANVHEQLSRYRRPEHRTVRIGKCDVAAIADSDVLQELPVRPDDREHPYRVGDREGERCRDARIAFQ